MLQQSSLQCPYCGERIDILLDGSVACQEYIEDCSVCCRPMVVTAVTTDDDVQVSVRAEHE